MKFETYNRHRYGCDSGGMLQGKISALICEFYCVGTGKLSKIKTTTNCDCSFRVVVCSIRVLIFGLFGTFANQCKIPEYN